MHTSIRRRSRWPRLVAPVLAALVVVGTAACGAAEPSASAGKNDAEIILAATGAPPSLDPALLDEGQSTYIWSSIFDTLIYLDNNGELQPNAAESWEYSEDGLTLTFVLRGDMTFSNGDPVNAEAVKATLERTQATPGPQQGRLANVESIEAPDDTTVVINLSAPDATLLTNFSLALGVIGDPATMDEGSAALDPVGSGAYVLDRDATVDGSTYVLTRRDDHWNADAYPFKKLTVRVIQDRTAVYNALQAGEITAGNVAPDQVQPIEAAGFSTKPIPAVAVANLLILDRAGEIAPPLADIRVRQAINMAFDRAQYVESLLKGAGLATEQLFNPEGVAYDETLSGTYEFDVEGAKDLLTDAGYPNGFAVTMPSTFLSQTYEPSITQSLADIGITVNWEPIPPQEVASSLSSKKYPMAFFLDGLNVAQRELQNNFDPNGFLNPFGYQDSELTELMDQAALASPDDQAGIYQQINAFIVENALDAPLFYFGTTWATKAGIEYLGTGANNASTVRAFGVTE